MEDKLHELGPVPYPWMLFKEGEDDRNQIFFKKDVLSKRRSNPIRQVLSCHIGGWLFILEKGGQCCLHNPITLESIQLPSLVLKKSKQNLYDCIMPSSSPLDSLFIIFLDYDSLVFCRVGDQQWAEQRLEDDGIDSVLAPVCCDGKIYLIAYLIADEDDRPRRSHMVVIDQNIRDGRIAIHLLGSLVPLIKDHSYYVYSYLVESCGEMFLLYRAMGGKNYLELTGFEVHRFDFSLMEWTRLESAEDRVFFVDEVCAYSYRVVNPETEGNRIYLTLADRRIYSYHIQENTVLVSLPSPDCKSPWSSPVWVMPNRRYGEIKHEIDEEAKEDGDRLCELPLDVLSYIASCLRFLGYINFRLVNKTCRLVAPPVHMKEFSRDSLTPWLLFCKKGEDKCKFIDPIRLESYRMNNPYESNEVRMCYAKQGWCLMLQGDDTIYLWNPFTRKSIPLPKSPHLPDFLNDTIIGCEFLSPPDSSQCVIVLVCDLSSLISFDYINMELETWETRFIFDWRYISVSQNHNPVFYNDELYFLQTNGFLDVMSEDFVEIESPCKSFYQNFLLAANGKLLGVFLGFMGKWIKVFEWDPDEWAWVEVDSVGDQTLYISRISSFATTATTEEMKNTICFPRFHGDNLVYYSLTSRKLHCYGSNAVLENFYNTKEQLYTCWIETRCSID